MVCKRILIAAYDGCRRQADAVRSDLEQALGPAAPDIDCFEPDSPPTARDIRVMREAGILVVPVAARQSTATVLSLIDAADQIGLPILVLRTDRSPPEGRGTFAGALSMPGSSTGEAIAAAIDALMHGGAEARRLRTELAFAHRCSGGLEGEIVKMHEELQLAAMVQRELLPRELPAVHGVTFGTLWRPANYVSGDIFDVMRLDEDHVGLFLADAVGHGVPAALLTMVISRSLVMKEIIGNEYRLLPPSEVLSRLNRSMLERETKSTRFATAVCALIDCRRRVAKIAAAGHPSPLLVRGDGEMMPIETGGGLLGIFAEEPYDHVEVELQLDDRLLFYSDGFEQAFPGARASSDDYERRLPTTRYRSEFCAMARSGPPQQCIERLRKRLDAQTGSLHQIDDLTLICAHAGPLSAEARKPAVITKTGVATVGD